MLAQADSKCTPSSASHNDHSEAVAHCNEPSFSFANVSATRVTIVTSFTCRHCSHFLILQVGAQMRAALAQGLRALQVAAALAQFVTCGLTGTIFTAERDRQNVVYCDRGSVSVPSAASEGVKCGDDWTKLMKSSV